MNDTREHRDNLKEQIIENWCIHMQQDYDRGEIVNYVEEDHVDDIGQAGFYNLSGIDWEMLKKQKINLLEIISYLENQVNDDSIKPKAKEMEGIVNLIDGIQDYAVDVMGVEETKVFDSDTIWGTQHKDQMEEIIIRYLSAIGMDMPDNLEDIVQFVYEDIMECCEPEGWTDSDVSIGLRRWMEKVTEK